MAKSFDRKRLFKQHLEAQAGKQSQPQPKAAKKAAK